MKLILPIIYGLSHIWIAFWVAVKVMPDGWCESTLAHWWTIPALVTLVVYAATGLGSALYWIGTFRDDY